MDIEIPFITDEGYEYLVVFQEYLHYSALLGVKIVDVSILLLSENIEQSSHKSLSTFIKIIKEYLHQNRDTVIYYYCDSAPIKMRQGRKEKYSPQEFRSRLFISMFNRATSQEFILVEVNAKDTAAGSHYTSLITHQHNHEKISGIVGEIQKLLNKPLD